MDLTTLINLIMQIGELVIKYGPTEIKNIENIWSNLKLAYQSASTGTPLTADQQAQYDEALSAANDALNASIANRAVLEAQG